VRGGSVVISATSPNGARDRRTIAIGPVQVARAAPALATGPAAGPQPLINALVSPAGASSFTAQALSPPEAVLFAGKLVMTTTAREAGQVSLHAYLGDRALGGCAVQTPGGRGFTCQLRLGGVSPFAPIRVSAGLRVGARIERSQRPAGRIPPFEMHVPDPLQPNGQGSPSWQFVCGL